MKKSSVNKKKILSTLAVAFFIVTGTYNAVVINSESSIGDAKFVKRLDEIYGVTTEGRVVAAAASWQKLSKTEVAKYAPMKKSFSSTKLVAVSSNNDVVNEVPSQAAVQEDLSLNLVEVINPKKYAQGLGTDKFSGNLLTNNGVIESLNVSLPNGEGVEVSFSEMSGNVFEYDYNGDVFSGMMYQVDQSSYMVTLTNGPLEGTRLRFNSTSEESMQESRDYLAENHGMNVGEFGQDAPQAQEAQPEMMVENNQPQQDTQNPDQNFQAQGFNFETQAM